MEKRAELGNKKYGKAGNMGVFYFRTFASAQLRSLNRINPSISLVDSVDASLYRRRPLKTLFPSAAVAVDTVGCYC